MTSVIACDLDEVLGTFVEQLAQFHNRVYNTNLSLSDFDSYQFWNVWGGNAKEAATKINEFFESPEFDSLKPIPGAHEALKELKEKGYTLVLVTSRQTFLKEKTMKFLDKNYPGIFDQVRLGNHYGEGKKKSKPEMCRELGASILIDDSLKYCTECAHDDIKAVLFDLNGEYPWNNTDEPLHSNITRVSNWKEALNVVLGPNKID
eukprot:gb/GECH01001568.1/.p1 GENE.gb/GECH01001568.1/~~gb/GECH01001568.1/.p1  ORF type:complete len:205 (+),score=54.90 gb/GECH01001568.1/:1-615(+)